MTVKEIIENYLVCHGFGGLCNMDGECGCELSDLAPCGQSIDRCEPGYKVLCTEECSHEGDHDVSKGDWHIQIDKPEEQPCGKCGKYTVLPGGFCPGCGAVVEGP